MQLPLWAETRPYQEQAIQGVVDAFKDNKFVFLDAPTGSGKTLIGCMVAKAMGWRCLYLCSSISLQEQFCRDYPEAALLKGRSNYPTLDNPELFQSKIRLSCADCTKLSMQLKDCIHCSEIKDCPYEVAKRNAYEKNIVCTNTSYFLTEANYVGKLINPSIPTLVVIDEADTLEKVLSSFIEVRITKRAQERYHIYPPTKKTVEGAWKEWLDSTIPKVRASLSDARQQLRQAYGNQKVIVGRSINYLTALTDSLSVLGGIDGISSGNWVYTEYNTTGAIVFKPVHVSSLAEKYVWRHAAKFLLMSATIISSDVMAYSLGIQ